MRKPVLRNLTRLFLPAMLILFPAASGHGSEKDFQIARLDAARSYRYLNQVCLIGPRVSGSQGMQKQQELLLDHFQKLNATIKFQAFDAVHPVNGTPVRMNNMIVSWHPEAKTRILVACHYDTRPYPERDRRNPRGRFIGANDGGSGVAMLMEMGNHMAGLEFQYGIDFVFFDGEELIYFDHGTYFLGSEHFAKQYRDNPPGYQYQYGILVDMIGDKRLNLYMEKNSLKYAPDLTKSIWKLARKMGVDEFHYQEKHEVQDDHLPLNKIAKIPTCDLIDFDYPYWHTSGDVPRSCSGKSIATVGEVVLNWLRLQENQSPELLKTNGGTDGK